MDQGAHGGGRGERSARHARRRAALACRPSCFESISTSAPSARSARCTPIARRWRGATSPITSSSDPAASVRSSSSRRRSSSSAAAETRNPGAADARGACGARRKGQLARGRGRALLGVLFCGAGASPAVSEERRRTLCRRPPRIVRWSRAMGFRDWEASSRRSRAPRTGVAPLRVDIRRAARARAIRGSVARHDGDEPRRISSRRRLQGCSRHARAAEGAPRSTRYSSSPDEQERSTRSCRASSITRENAVADVTSRARSISSRR